jgi:hypothetical protein
VLFKRSREAEGSVALEPDPASPGPAGSDVGASAWDDLREAIRAEFTDVRTFYLTGAGRSGTTSCSRILGTASNARTVTEPAPNLALAVRDYRQGWLRDPRPVIWRNRIDAMRRVLGETRFYGEKDLKTYCWLPYYRDLFNPRFVLVSRDGREVVASLLDWHYRVHGNLYRELDDDDRLGPQALARRKERPLERDQTEQGRPRPRPGDPAYEAWPSMSRTGMFAWYWSHTMRVAQRDLYRIEDGRWRTIEYGADLDAGAFRTLFDFLELDGFDEGVVASMLADRINSFAEKASEPARTLGPWTAWSDEQMAEFERHAGDAMVELGHAGLDRRTRPDMPDGRRDAPVTAAPSPLPAPACADLGLGSTVGRAERTLLVGRAETGVPADPPAPGVTTWAGGPLGTLPDGPFDAVVALGVIDRGPDMDDLLERLASRTTGRLVVTASRGDFPERIAHGYAWAADGTPRHEWCVARSRSLLRRHLGFGRVSSGAVSTGDPRCPRLSYVSAAR